MENNMSEMPKEIFVELVKQDDCGLRILDAYFLEYQNTTKYIRKDEHERLIAMCESYHEKEIEKLKKEIEIKQNTINDLREEKQK